MKEAIDESKNLKQEPAHDHPLFGLTTAGSNEMDMCLESLQLSVHNFIILDLPQMTIDCLSISSRR